GGRDADPVCGGDDLDPGGGGEFALGEHPADVVVEDLRGGAGDAVEAGVLGGGQELGEGQAGAGGAVDDLHRGEGVQVDARLAAFDLEGEVEVGGAGQVGVDAALHADLGRPGRPGLVDAVADLGHGQGVGVGVGAALGEGAEPAAGVADVGEVDVAVDHVGDVLAVDVGAHRVGQRRERVQVGAVGAQQRQVLAVREAGRVRLGAAQRGLHLR